MHDRRAMTPAHRQEVAPTGFRSRTRAVIRGSALTPMPERAMSPSPATPWRHDGRLSSGSEPHVGGSYGGGPDARSSASCTAATDTAMFNPGNHFVPRRKGMGIADGPCGNGPAVCAGIDPGTNLPRVHRRARARKSLHRPRARQARTAQPESCAVDPRPRVEARRGTAGQHVPELMTGYISISYGDLALAAILLIVNAGLSIRLGLGLERQMMIAAVRMTAQLLLVGVVLKFLFAPRIALGDGARDAGDGGDRRLRGQRPPGAHRIAGGRGYALGTLTAMTAGVPGDGLRARGTDPARSVVPRRTSRSRCSA